MMIDIPVLIAFDCQHAERAKPHLTRVFTIRVDIDDNDLIEQCTLTYPPDEHADWWMDKDGIVLGLLPLGAWEKIVKAARRNPADYCSDPAEGEMRQEDVDAAAAADGQFGVGA